jgi:hypothetical protein
MVGPFAHAAPPVSSQQGAEALRDELVRIFRLAGLLAIPDAMLAEPTAMVDNGNTLNLGQALFAAYGNH